jgi:hypothetical protein
MSKTKNKSNKGKPLRLNDAVLQYHAKNYTGALSRLKSAEIRPDEAPKAKKLEYILTLKLGFQELRIQEYAKTIAILQPLTPSDAIASGLTGIAYLYLLQYEKAIPFLKEAANVHPTFVFYELLAELYLNQTIDFQSFTNDNAVQWAKCSESQRQYLEIVSCVFNEQKEQAVVLAKGLKMESHFQHINWDAFKNILIPNDASVSPTTAISDKVKSWYRLLLNADLLDFEKKHLLSLGEIAANRLEGTQKVLPQSFQKAIDDQYNEQKVLDDHRFGQLVQEVLPSQRPYVVYNQAVNAFQQPNQSLALQVARHILSKYMSYFVGIPESLPLFFRIYDHPDYESNPTAFWQVVKKWLAVHKDNLSIEQIDALGWRITGMVLEYAELITSHHHVELMRVSRELPASFALKFAQLVFPTTQTPIKNITDTRLDLFSLPNAEKSREKFAEIFNGFLEVISPYGKKKKSLPSFWDDEEELILPKSVFIQQIVYLGETLMTAVEKYPIPPRNLVILEGFKTVHQYLKLIQEHKNGLPKLFYEQFIDVYERVLNQLPQTVALLPFKEDAAYRTHRKYVLELKQILELNPSMNSFLNFISEFNEVPYRIIWEEFCQLIDKQHFKDELAQPLSNALAAVFFQVQTVEAGEIEVNRFINVYKKLAETNDCKHPTTFYGSLIMAILKQKEVQQEVIYLFCAAYIEQLTLKHPLEPKQYNAVAEFLAWIKSKKFYLNPLSDKMLLQKLRSYLQEVNQTEKIKKLETVLNNSAVFA